MGNTGTTSTPNANPDPTPAPSDGGDARKPPQARRPGQRSPARSSTQQLELLRAPPTRRRERVSRREVRQHLAKLIAMLGS